MLGLHAEYGTAAHQSMCLVDQCALVAFARAIACMDDTSTESYVLVLCQSLGANCLQWSTPLEHNNLIASATVEHIHTCTCVSSSLSSLSPPVHMHTHRITTTSAAVDSHFPTAGANDIQSMKRQ